MLLSWLGLGLPGLGVTRTWVRRTRRTSYLLLFLASLAYVLSTGSRAHSVAVWREVAEIYACALVAEICVLVLGLVFSRCTSGVLLHVSWHLSITLIVMCTGVSTGTLDLHRESLTFALCTALTPAWLALYVKELLDHMFTSFYDYCDHQVARICTIDVRSLCGGQRTTVVGHQAPSKNRVSALLALTLAIRLGLQVLSTGDLGPEATETLEKFHRDFVSSVSMAHARDRQRHRAFMERWKRNDKLPRGKHPQVHGQSYINELTEACVVFLAQIVSVFLGRLREHASDQAGEIFGGMIWHPAMRQASRRIVSGISSNFLDKLEVVMRPLPSLLEPDSLPQLLVSTLFVGIMQRLLLAPGLAAIGVRVPRRLSKRARQFTYAYLAMRWLIYQARLRVARRDLRMRMHQPSPQQHRRRPPPSGR